MVIIVLLICRSRKRVDRHFTLRQSATSAPFTVTNSNGDSFKGELCNFLNKPDPHYVDNYDPSLPRRDFTVTEQPAKRCPMQYWSPGPPNLNSGNLLNHHSASHLQPRGRPVVADGHARYDSQTLHQNDQSMQGLVDNCIW